MQHLELDYEDVGETAVTGRPTTDLHDLRTILVSTNPVVARRVQRILTPMGARLSVIPDWGHVSLAEVRGLDPQLVLLDPSADLKSRADANRRLAEEPRLKWAVIDRVPQGLEGQAGVNRLVELAAVALGADRQLQAEILLQRGSFVAPIEALGPGRLLRALALFGGTHRVTYRAPEVEASLTLGGANLVEARWVESGPNAHDLDGVAALTAFTALYQGDVEVRKLELKVAGKLGRLEELLEDAADPALSWVATRVATGRYLFPPAGVLASREGDLPVAERTRRAKPQKITVNVLPIAGSRTIPGVAGLAAQAAPALTMPRMPRVQGPKPVMEDVARPSDVAVQSIVSLRPADPVEAPAEAAQEYEDGAISSLDLEVDIELDSPDVVPQTIEAHVAFPPTATSIPAFGAAAPAPAPVSVWPEEAAPVSAADSIRPALSPVVIPKRRLWPWALAALAVLGLGVGGAATALVLGSTTLADYTEGSGDLFAQIESLDLDLPNLGETTAPGTVQGPVPPAEQASLPTVVADPTEAPPETGPDEMVFALSDADADAPADDRDEERSPRARRRAERREIRALIEEADASATAEEAAVRYQAVLERDPHNAAAMRSLARAKIATGDYAAAVTWAERATRERPRHAPSWGTLGDALRRTGDDAGAQAAYGRAAALDPATPAPRVVSNQEAVAPTEAAPENDQDAAPTAPRSTEDPLDHLAPRVGPGALPPAL